MRDQLLTRDRLRSWGIAISATCLLCDALPESRSHLLTECAFTIEIWRSFFAHPVFNLPQSIDDRCHSPTGNGKVNSICMLLVQAITYCLWRERNARLHGSSNKPVHVLIKEINLLLRAKLFGMDRATSPLVPLLKLHKILTFTLGSNTSNSDPLPVNWDHLCLLLFVSSF